MLTVVVGEGPLTIPTLRLEYLWLLQLLAFCILGISWMCVKSMPICNKSVLFLTWQQSILLLTCKTYIIFELFSEFP